MIYKEKSLPIYSLAYVFIQRNNNLLVSVFHIGLGPLVTLTTSTGRRCCSVRRGGLA